MKNFSKNVVTLGPLGYLPASGTVGSLVALPIAYFMCFVAMQTSVILCLLSFFVALLLVNISFSLFRSQDPSEIIIDEFVGCLVLFCGISWGIKEVIFGFLLYRLLDIYKPLGIKYFEKLPKAYGIMTDDLVAALVANCVLRFLFI